MNDDIEVEVVNEEVITHMNFERTSHGLRGEARVIVTVISDGNTYTCEKVIPLSFKKSLAIA